MPLLRLGSLLTLLSAAHGFVPTAPAPVLNRAGSVSPLLSPRPATLRYGSSRAAAAPVLLADGKKEGNGLPFFLDMGTKGGIVFYTFLLIALPFIAYSFMIDNLGYDVVLAGNVILVGYVGVGTVVWTGSYVFRVANKDMTYAQQLRDYENAVIQKRFEELSEEEVDALMGEIYPGQPGQSPPPSSK